MCARLSLFEREGWIQFALVTRRWNVINEKALVADFEMESFRIELRRVAFKLIDSTLKL